MRCYLISQSHFFFGSRYSGNFAYVCSTCFLYPSLNIWCTVKNKKKEKKTCLSICVVLTQVVHCTRWNDAGTQKRVVGCTTVPLSAHRRLVSNPWIRSDCLTSHGLVLFLVCSLISVFCFLSLSAVLGKCYCVVLDQRSFHIPIHILYWFINRHFYKNNEKFLS